MTEPNTIAEIEAWLEPLGYDEFWDAITPHCPRVAPRYRAECDEAVESGQFTKNEALRIYKFWSIEALAFAFDPTYDATRRGLAAATNEQLLSQH